MEEHAARLDAPRLTLWVALASCVAAVSVALASDNPVWALAVTALLAAIALATTDESPVRARVAITIAAASFIGLHAAVGLEPGLYLLIVVSGIVSAGATLTGVLSKGTRDDAADPPVADFDEEPRSAMRMKAEPNAQMPPEVVEAAHLSWNVLEALRGLPGPVNKHDLMAATARAINLPRESREVKREDGRTEWRYRVEWSVSALRMLGAVERNSPSLTSEGAAFSRAEVIRRATHYFDNKLLEGEYQPSPYREPLADAPLPGTLTTTWIEEVRARMFSMSPTAFEHFCAELIRADDYDVTITGGPRDGGLDGVARSRSEANPAKVYFQAKKWRGYIGPQIVREFRGALSGRAGSGLLITSGSFTPDARTEAQRTAPNIKLIDGEQIAAQMRKHEIGVSLEDGQLRVDEEWFSAFTHRWSSVAPHTSSASRQEPRLPLDPPSTPT